MSNKIILNFTVHEPDGAKTNGRYVLETHLATPRVLAEQECIDGAGLPTWNGVSIGSTAAEAIGAVLRRLVTEGGPRPIEQGNLIVYNLGTFVR